MQPPTSTRLWPLGLFLLSAAMLMVLAAVLPWLPLFVAPARLPPADGPPAAPADAMTLHPVVFDDLPGYRRDRLTAALPALQTSCERLITLPASRAMGGDVGAGRVGDWIPACTALLDLDPAASDAAIRARLEAHFRPYAVSVAGRDEGLFTGYFEPLLQGSFQPDARYRVPLHARPPSLVDVDLGAFRRDLAGQRIAGKVENGRLQPFYARSQISTGALAGQGLELIYVDNAVDAFILHIQGSGRIELPDGRRLRVAYAGQNGHPYFAIGRALLRRGALKPGEVSMPAIRQWLLAHPDEADAVMNQNRSYIFFRREADDGLGPKGAAGVPLTAGRSLAVDRTRLPYHAPLWLDAEAPDPESPAQRSRPVQRLMVAQDTGGAIRGEIRGDVFWGAGERARQIAGHMAHRGRYFLLLPKALLPTKAETRNAAPSKNPPAAP